ncbi:MAG: hypothetical protein AAEJ04_04605 [Planctomycetota bacterium]
MRPVIFVLLILISVAGLTEAVVAQQSMTIAAGSTQGLAPKTLVISMDAVEDVEGYVLSILFDESLLLATDFWPISDSAAADLIVSNVYSSGVTLGVVMDTVPPFDGNKIPGGDDREIAALTLAPLASVSTDTVVDLEFVDDVFNSPPLSNVIVQGGLSIGVDQGLELEDGTLTLFAGEPVTMFVENGSAPADGAGSVGVCRILLDNDLGTGGVQGFVSAVSHDSTALTLEEIAMGEATEAAGAEFAVANIYENGGTYGVVLDFQAPFDGQVIPEGTGIHLASFGYSCVNSNIYSDGDPGAPPQAETSAVTLVDGVLGDPILNNVVVIEGLSIDPVLLNGVFTCLPVEVPSEDTVLWMETEFDEGAGNYAYHGQTGDLCFYYRDDDDYLQGFTFTVCYDCNLTIDEDSWVFNGSILDQVGIEYLAVQVDDDCSDGETGELIVALLLDALPPFEGQTLPQTENLAEGRLLVGKMRVTVDDDAECNEAQPIYWCNDIDGNGDVVLETNVVIEFQSIKEFERHDTLVFVVPEEIFQRGDCNSDDKVDLADSATMLGNQFSGVPILCPDACDANDDGLLNMADSVYLLNWLFKFGPILPAPGPYNDGPDPTQDDTLPVCDSDDTNC